MIAAVILVLAGWLVLSVLVSLALGYGIHTADRREASPHRKGARPWTGGPLIGGGNR